MLKLLTNSFMNCVGLSGLLKDTSKIYKLLEKMLKNKNFIKECLNRCTDYSVVIKNVHRIYLKKIRSKIVN